MNVQNNKSDSQFPAVKGASSPKNVDEPKVELMEEESNWGVEGGRSHIPNVQIDNHHSSAASEAAAQGSSFEPSGPTATNLGAYHGLGVGGDIIGTRVGGAVGVVTC